MMISTDIIVGAAGGLVALAGGAAVIWRIALPHIKSAISSEIAPYEAKLEEVHQLTQELEQRSLRDYEALQKSASVDQALLKTLFVLLKHAETDNERGLIAEQKEDLQTFIVEKL
jgi:hypothetical protein